MEIFPPEKDEENAGQTVSWHDTLGAPNWVLGSVYLVIAGVLIIGSAIVTLLNMDDRIIFGVLVPGFIVGLFFVGLYIRGGGRVKNRRQMATTINKKRTAI
jgi:hypothetical protein